MFGNAEICYEESKSMYKMIAVDMDGTLLKEDKTISSETIRAINLAKSKGVKIVLATGRPVDGIRNYLKELNLTNEDDYAIAFNGALVQSTKTGEVVSNRTLSMKDLIYLHDLALSLNIDMHAFTNDGLITPAISKYTEVEATINGITPTVLDFNKLDKNNKLIKFMMVGDKPSLDKVYEKLPIEVFNQYTVVRSAPYFLEFLHKDSNKGEAVKTLAKHLNIRIEEVICIGDAGNDYHMIKYAGLGVAMDNAFPEVKEIADYITKTNENDGVAHVIKKFILAS
jgi:Cof subfamily protein (haloacid dehalogenase superfamily)